MMNPKRKKKIRTSRSIPTNTKDSKESFLYNVDMKYVIYDFNGTILDDIDVCLKAENNTIEHYKLDRGPLTKDEYLRIFTFPVKDYYESVGFDWSVYSYEEVGQYWFGWYRKLRDEYKVHDGVIEVLEKNHEKGNKNILLSASSLVELKKQLEELHISAYFDEVLGIDNIYAGSKIDIALDWIKDKDPKDCMMIGDTLHDLQTANAMGIDCILVANGHQAKDLLLEEYDKVVDDIREVELI